MTFFRPKLLQRYHNGWGWLVGLLVILGTTLPIFNPSFFRVHDFTSAARLVEMERGLAEGQFPVRWSANFGYGYGMPLFNFYGPLPYYLAALVGNLGVPVITSLKILLMFITASGFIGMYLLGKRLFGTAAGVVAATVFTMFPYRAVDFYVRGAWNEVFAIALLPWILLIGIKFKAQANWQSVGWLSVFLAALLCTHNLLFVMFFPVIYGWSILWALQGKQRIRATVYVHIGLLLGFALGAFYALPAYFEKDLTLVDKIILGGYFDYNNHFLYIRQWFLGTWGYGGSTPWPYTGMYLALGWPAIVLASIGSLAWFLRRQKLRIFLVFLVTASIAALLLTTFKSKFIWDAISFMQYFQFPWRFLSVLATLLSLLAAASVLWIPSRRGRGIFAVLVIASSFVLYGSFFQPEKFLDNPDSMYYTDPVRIQTQMSDILHDYVPATVKKMPLPGQALLGAVQADLHPLPQILVDRAQEKLIRVQLQSPQDLVLRVFSFPGWKIYVDGQLASVRLIDEYGWAHFSVPEGSHLVSARLEDTPLRAISNLLSLVAVGIVGRMLVYGRRSRS